MDTPWISELNLIDLVAVIYILYGMVRGFMRGLSGELARVIGMGVTFFLGWQFYEEFGAILAENSRLEGADAELAGFLLILVGVGVGTILIRWILRNLMEFTFKEPLEKVGGVVAGGIRCGAWVAVVLVAAILSPSEYLNRKFGEDSQAGSLVARHVLPAYQRLAEDMPDWGLPGIPEDGPAPKDDRAEAPEKAESEPGPADGE